MKKATIALLLICTAVFAQQKGTFTDSRDKKKYKTVKIGEQTWMAENLNYEAEGSKCYEDKPANCTKYGRLYDWVTAMALDTSCYNVACSDKIETNHKDICPEGWHLPSLGEFDALITKAGGFQTAGGKLKAKSGWDKDGSKNGNGTDNYGFSALPGGFFDDISKKGQYMNFYGVGVRGNWWNTSEVNEYDSKNKTYSYNKAQAMFITSSGKLNGDGSFKNGLSSVRCLQNYKGWEEVHAKARATAKERFEEAVKNNVERAEKMEKEAKERAEREAKEKAEREAKEKAEKEARKFIDIRDKKTYNSVNIGSQTWMVENLNYDAKDSKCYDNKPANCDKYGRLYDWKTATTACPKGWHLPSKKEWEELKGFVEKRKDLKAKSGWNKNGNGTDDYGFSALPGGYYGGPFKTKIFDGIGDYGYWWTASELNGNDAYSQFMANNAESLNESESPKSGLNSIRCLKD